ncbi:MAG: hypothetical protein K1X66_00840 [Verrucomicrobiae bacterium]|nr:hypothetical protein [Verrucomicrobiae bacterium]
MANLELLRILSEWRLRFKRIKEILAPPLWSKTDWQVFSCTLAVMVQKHGAHWEQEGKRYWDMRWSIREGGELVCQIEQMPQKSVCVVVAQTGGFAGDEGYTWLWAEFDTQGQFIHDPYFVDGTWKEALLALLLPYSGRAGFYLGNRAASPALLQEKTESS